MGVTEFPCPGCGQAQKVRAPNGTEVNTQALCAACREAKANEEAEKHKGARAR